MSQNPPPSPTENPSTEPRSSRTGSSADLTNEQLAAQARAAADQALQLAKLAEESARLARHLNEQVLARSGQSVFNLFGDGRDPPETTHITVDRPEPFSLVTTIDQMTTTLKSRRRKRRRGSAQFQQMVRIGQDSPTERPQQVKIRTKDRDVAHDHVVSPVTELVRNWKSLFLSTGFHAAVLLLLGLLTYLIEPVPPIDTILASFVEADRTPIEALPVEQPMDQPGEQQEQPKPDDQPPDDPEPQQDLQQAPPEQAAGEAAPEPMLPPARKSPPEPVGAKTKPGAGEPAVDVSQVGSRSEAGKAYLLKKYGGTAAGESAVSRALDWFVSIQRRDGSWNFNDVGRASQAGTVNNPMGATSYVLLAFLGTGQTHMQGKYKKSVGQGIRFLLQNARAVPAGADFRGPNVEESHNFYVQGAAAMALCEAYAMTKDRKLRKPAEGAVQFIIAAQDPRGGGWRYAPREPGCTSVTTLQLTALKSAERCGLTVPPRVLDGVRHFYTTVKCDQEPTGRYAYRAEGLSYKSSSTAQAALGRMLLGATREDDDLQAAVALLDQRGPYENRYYCYYAAQVLKNWGGPEWERWNDSLREELIRTQDAGDGPARGSWAPLQRGPTDISGGRLFTTALSTLTLEVYYRYLPLYDMDNDDPDMAKEAADTLTPNVPAVRQTTP